MLEYTGHPFVDVGVATITAFANKSDPRQVTDDDLIQVGRYIEENYTRNPLRSFLTVAFTSNAWFAQDAYNPDKPGLSDVERQKRRESRTTWADRHLRSWNETASGNAEWTCVFTGAPVVAGTLSNKLIAGRAGRAQVPLLQGDDNINFYAQGDSGLPVSGIALLCLQVFPLGCAKVAGSLLAVHADDPRLTFQFALRNLRHNLAAVNVAQQNGSDKLEEEKHAVGTLLIGTLLDLATQRANLAADDEDLPTSVTAYHFNNGQTPKLDLHFIPIGVTSFLQLVTSASYREQWNALARRAWQLPPKAGGKGKASAAPFEPRRNYLYEDVLTLPDGAPRFLRRYFLRAAFRYAREDDPRRGYSPVDEAGLISWDLTALFLRKVLNMDQRRIDEIRQLGDRLSVYVRNDNDRRFFRAVLTETRYPPFRLALIRADLNAVQHGQAPLMTFDQYVEIFEDGEEIARADWRLARDLVLIRMIEQLNGNGWLAGNADELRQVVSQVAAEEESSNGTPAVEAVE